MQMYGMTGEVLGSIGQPAEPPPQQLPTWKQEFLSKTSVSMRRGIAWGFDAPYEDTDTLVLTAPSGQFVDVRFPKDTNKSNDTTAYPSFWAFSGTSKTTFYDANSQDHAIDMPYTAHCQFLHDIDSRGPGIVDEGDMFLLANGECLEMGIMINPASGKNELYKERWVSADMIPKPDGEYDTKVCIVAYGVGAGLAKGIMIRIGSIVQGIASRSSADKTVKVEVERWQRNPEGKWLRDTRSNGSFPVEWLISEQRKLGDELDEGNMSWKITEVKTQ